MAGFSNIAYASLALLTETSAESDGSGRIFGLDAQLLFDVCVQAIAVFLLFIFLSYILINPVRKVLEDRQAKIKDDIANATRDKEEAAKYKAEYEEKIKQADKEADEILSEARRKAIKNEESIIGDAKEEASRIIAGANQEAALEKEKVKDEVRQEIIGVATAMAGKFVENSLDDAKQQELIDEALKEMGDDTWQSK